MTVLIFKHVKMQLVSILNKVVSHYYIRVQNYFQTDKTRSVNALSSAIGCVIRTSSSPFQKSSAFYIPFIVQNLILTHVYYCSWKVVLLVCKQLGSTFVCVNMLFLEIPLDFVGEMNFGLLRVPYIQ